MVQFKEVVSRVHVLVLRPKIAVFVFVWSFWFWSQSLAIVTLVKCGRLSRLSWLLGAL